MHRIAEAIEQRAREYRQAAIGHAQRGAFKYAAELHRYAEGCEWSARQVREALAGSHQPNAAMVCGCGTRLELPGALTPDRVAFVSCGECTHGSHQPTTPFSIQATANSGSEGDSA